MGRRHRRSVLSQHIGEILNEKSEQRMRPTNGPAVPSVAARTLACGGVALLTLGAGSAGAVGLGKVQLRSSLGAPLRATVPLQIAPGETLTGGCVSVPRRPTGALQGLRSPRITVPEASQPGTYQLQVTTTAPLYEPMYELSLRVDCPGAPVLVRHYVLMLDLPGMEPVAAENRTTRPVNMPTPAQERRPAPAIVSGRQNRPAPPRARRQRDLTPARDPIPAGTIYRVREGDTLSTIAARIDGRPPNSIWQLADTIFAANPEAFIRDNPDLIKLGSTIQIPGPSEWQSAAPSATVAAQPAPAPTAQEQLPQFPEIADTAPRASADRAPASASAPDVSESRPEPATRTSEGPAEVTAAVSKALQAARENRSPFMDEQPPPVVAAPTKPVPSTVSRDSDTAEAPIPTVVSQSADKPQSRAVSPLLAVAVGVLLGLALSMLLLRGRLLQAVGALFGRRRAKQQAASPATDLAYEDTGDAFGGVPAPDAEPEFEPLPVQHTTAQDYIVETQENPALPSGDADGAAAPQPTLVALPEHEPSPLAAIDDDLAALFEETLGAAEVDIHIGENDPTREVPGGLAPTQDMPGITDEDDSIPVAAISQEGPTVDAPVLDTDDPDEADLEALSQTIDEDDNLSATLTEALALLEQDHAGDLTTSQVIDMSEMEKALDGGDNDEEEMTVERKRTG